jgi:hypothetical protein
MTISRALAASVLPAALLVSITTSQAGAGSGEGLPSTCLRYRRACALLGWELRLDTGGRECPSVLAFSRGTPFRAMGTRTMPRGIAVTVNVGLQELDHYRMLSWRALVARETGPLRVLETRLVAT